VEVEAVQEQVAAPAQAQLLMELPEVLVAVGRLHLIRLFQQGALETLQ
jgi:hypothetical protein